MENPELTALSLINLIAFIVVFVIFTSGLVWLAALICKLPNRSLARALTAGAGVSLTFLASNILATMLHPLIALPLAVLLPSLVISRVYAATIGRAVLAYVVIVLILISCAAIITALGYRAA